MLAAILEKSRSNAKMSYSLLGVVNISMYTKYEGVTPNGSKVIGISEKKRMLAAILEKSRSNAKVSYFLLGFVSI